LGLLKSAFADVGIEIGERLEPTVSDLTEELTLMLDEMVASPEFDEFIIVLTDAMEELLPAIVDLLPELTELGEELIPLLIDLMPVLMDKWSRHIVVAGPHSRMTILWCSD
jgi:hypothetical protein